MSGLLLTCAHSVLGYKRVCDLLADSMWQLKIQGDKQYGIEDNSSFYPNRPGEPDCSHYLKTGFCGFGSRCRFNHPAKVGQVKAFLLFASCVHILSCH